MSIEDEIRTQRAAIEAQRKSAADAAALEQAWQKSGVKGAPAIQPCPEDLLSIINEVYEYLRFETPMYIGSGPDGIRRIVLASIYHTANCSVHPIQIARGSGKGSYTITIWIISKSEIAFSHAETWRNLQGSYHISADEVRKSIISWIAVNSDNHVGIPVQNRPSEQPSVTKTQQNAIQSREEAQAKLWTSQGLCQYCGGKLSFFSSKCKSCGKMN